MPRGNLRSLYRPLRGSEATVTGFPIAAACEVQ